MNGDINGRVRASIADRSCQYISYVGTLTLFIFTAFVERRLLEGVKEKLAGR